MVRFFTMVTLLVGGAGVAAAQAPTADCSTFRKGADGRWMSTIDAKVGNPKDFKTLEPGLPIDRSMTVAGLNVSATLDRLCGKK